MPWRDVWLTLQGIQMKESSFRSLGQIMIDLWAKSPSDLKRSWHIPFDGAIAQEQNVFNQLKQRQAELRQWQQQKK